LTIPGLTVRRLVSLNGWAYTLADTLAALAGAV
jgi:hypothetical protein